jgi:hypothetical protein
MNADDACLCFSVYIFLHLYCLAFWTTLRLFPNHRFTERPVRSVTVLDTRAGSSSPTKVCPFPLLGGSILSGFLCLHLECHVIFSLCVQCVCKLSYEILQTGTFWISPTHELFLLVMIRLLITVVLNNRTAINPSPALHLVKQIKCPNFHPTDDRNKTLLLAVQHWSEKSNANLLGWFEKKRLKAEWDMYSRTVSA